MPKTRQQKEEVIKSLTQLFKDSPSVVFANYQGLSVPQVDELRDKMFEEKLTYVVAKKTLINRAAKEAGFEIDSKQFPGMLGIAFGTDDEVAPAKVLGDMSKDTPLELVGGLFDGTIVTQEYVVTLSKLPSRIQLYGMFVNVINGPVSGFVRALDALRIKKEEEEGAPAPAPEAPKAEEAPAEAPKAEDKSAEEPAKEEAPAETPAPAEAPKAEEAPKADEKPAEEAPKE